jgi:hypothetical protein
MHNPHNPATVAETRREQFFFLLKFTGLAILALLIIVAFAPSELTVPVISVNLSSLALLFVLRSSYIYAPFRYQQGFQVLRLETADTYRALTVEQKLYANSILMALFTAFVYFTAGSALGAPLLVMTIFFVAFISIRDVLRWYRVLSENLLGKAVIALGFAIASNLAYALANQLVSQVIHVTPTNFLRTSLFIAILMIPVLMTFAGSVAFAVGSAVSSLVIILSLGPQLDKFRQWLFAGTWPVQTIRFPLLTRVFQLVLYMSIVSTISIMGGRHFAWYEEKVSGLIPGMVYHMDMYSANECNLGDNFKIAPLGDAKFLIAQKTATGISFQSPVKCDELAPPTNAGYSAHGPS